MIHFHRGPFRLGLRTWRYGIRFKVPFGKWHAIGRKP